MCLIGKVILPHNISPIFSGDVIDLTIEIENLEKIFVKEIYLTFRGVVNIKWDDLINKPKDGKIIYIMQQFEAQEIFVNQHISLQNMEILTKGKHFFSVIMKIPEQIPQSVQKKYGCIKYVLELVANTYQGIEILKKIPLEIKRYINIFSKQEYMQPFQTVFKKHFCWNICHTQPLKILLSLSNTSFIPGQFIKYYLTIENFTRFLDLQRVTVLFIQTQLYKALKPKTRIKQVHTTLSLMMHHFNRSHHNSNFVDSLKLPNDLETTSQEPGLLMFSYKLQFILKFRSFQTDGYISVPIIIGSHQDVRKEIENFDIKTETRLQIEENLKGEYEV